MRDSERMLQGLGGFLLAIATIDATLNRRVQTWHSLGVLCLAAGQGIRALREIGWTE